MEILLSPPRHERIAGVRKDGALEAPQRRPVAPHRPRGAPEAHPRRTGAPPPPAHPATSRRALAHAVHFGHAKTSRRWPSTFHCMTSSRAPDLSLPEDCPHCAAVFANHIAMWRHKQKCDENPDPRCGYCWLKFEPHKAATHQRKCRKNPQNRGTRTSRVVYAHGIPTHPSEVLVDPDELLS
jgi:hypothetical protein